MSESPQLPALGSEGEETARSKPEMQRRKRGTRLEGF